MSSHPAASRLSQDPTANNVGSIYVTRTILATYFNFRTESLSARLKDQQNERAATIRKLKAATKYDSTQELLEKYGGESKSKAKGKESEDQKEAAKGKVGPHHGQPGTPQRTNLPPPPTANIPRSDTRGSMLSHPGTPQSMHVGSVRGSPQVAGSHLHDMEPSAEFAPNAFGPEGAPPPVVAGTHQYAPAYQGPSEGHWYDRIMDLLLGEDETAPKNRIVLICSRCRLVNGQAPPGTKALSEIGTWKCMGCGTSNGEMDEGKKILKEVLGTQSRDADDSAESAAEVDEETHVGEDDNRVKEQEAGEETSGLKKRQSKT